ncbi:MAG: electron transfer flavoprotein subunit alpha/FixB family protein [Deltaproteobacteria bacterium]|jgi:electron transfer flavoprotein alpha subunit|nr:electron transfer flavoprotein subunit alpha/FixB family protein [Deltaproteobacteria bacterium]
MGSILIVAEIQAGQIRESSYELAAYAQKIAAATGREIASVVLGKDIAGAAEAFSQKGGGKVFVADDELLANYCVESASAAIRAAIEASGADVILLSNTPSGWDVAPRIAAGLDAGFVSDCSDVSEDGGKLVFERRVFSGRLDAHVRTNSDVVVATMQPGGIEPFGGSTEGSVVKLDVSLTSEKAKFIENKIAESKGVDLSKADVIVAGGRGVGAAENFGEILQPLADALGGAMGASRPVVDACWLDHPYQVGSSGQVVVPKLYIAAGISGAIQHLVGMKGSNFIIAINKDPDAPIFEVADLGAVGDLAEIVPALTKAIQEAKG